MKRIMVLLAAAAMMAMSGVAQAAPIGDSADAQCAKLAIRTLGPSVNPSNYTFIGGSASGDDFTGQGTEEGNDVFCGFGGVVDSMDTLNDGDIFLGGADRDLVITNSSTFYGQEGNDQVAINSGTFFGEEGIDSVEFNNGTFYGGDGNDFVSFNLLDGTFIGGPGNDAVGSGNPLVDGLP
jgi:hypothetical protein